MYRSHADIVARVFLVLVRDDGDATVVESVGGSFDILLAYREGNTGDSVFIVFLFYDGFALCYHILQFGAGVGDDPDMVEVIDGLVDDGLHVHLTISVEDDA